jgi:hypothetical protein
LAAFHLAGPLAEAIRYALARWPALTRFLDDGRIKLDNNPVERAIRPIARAQKPSDWLTWEDSNLHIPE